MNERNVKSPRSEGSISVEQRLTKLGIRVEQRLVKLGFTLPPPPVANGNYMPWVIDQGIFQTSGQLSREHDDIMVGRAKGEQDLDDARQAAILCVLRCLATVKAATGSLDKVLQIIALRGFINSTPDFALHSSVLDAASDLLIGIYGGKVGGHARTAVGVSSLPSCGYVEIEMKARVKST